MRITNIKLYRFKAFQFNRVELFDADFVTAIAICIGQNGSGKSSLMRELNPLPANRQDYGINGYKVITLIHGSSEYVLSSLFENKTSPHSFMKDGIELNTSGTSGIQEELVTTHLGYTKLLHDVMTGTYSFSTMPVSLRKTFLLTTNPFKLKFILDKHKAINSKLRACKDNLVMLYERKVALENTLLDGCTKVALCEENDELSKDIANVVEGIHKISLHIDNLKRNVTNDDNVPDIENIRRHILRIKKTLPLYKDIPRGKDLESYKQHVFGQRATLLAEIEATNRIVESAAADLDKYSAFIHNNDTTLVTGILEDRIRYLKDTIANSTISNLQSPFDKSIIDTIPEHLVHITDILGHFVGFNGEIIPPKEIRLLKDKFHKYDTLRRDILHEQDRLSDDIARLETRLTDHTVDVSADCTRTACALFNKYTSELVSLRGDVNKLHVSRDHFAKKLHRLNNFLRALGNKITSLETILPHMQELSLYLSTNEYLMIPLRSTSIIGCLKSNPFTITNKISTHWKDSLEWYTYQDLLRELADATRDYNNKSEDFNHQFVLGLVNEKRIVLDDARSDRAKQQSTLDNVLSNIALINDYETLLIDMRNRHDSIQRYQKNTELKGEISRYSEVLRSLYELRKNLVDRLTEIEHVLREQSSIEARYNDEILANITRIESERDEYAVIEKALSPNTGIPHRYTVNYINALIRNANVFISMVFSYTFEILPIDDDVSIDYEFSAKVGDVTVPKLAMCSSAQKDIIDLAFIFALAVQLKYTDYPVVLDETGRTFDHYHKQQLLSLLRTAVDDNIVSQMFLVNHDAIIHASFAAADLIVLNSDNIVTPVEYNTNVRMTKI